MKRRNTNSQKPQRQTPHQQRLYRELELISCPKPANTFAHPGFREVLDTMWQRIKAFLTPIEEPVIREVVDDSGNLYWQVYNPGTDETVQWNSMQEVLTWLEEQRHARARALACFDF